MAIFNFELFVDVEADDFESALSWLKAIAQEINTLAKKHYGEMDLAFSWGCAQGLLTAKQLELILGILKEKEEN